MAGAGGEQDGEGILFDFWGFSSSKFGFVWTNDKIVLCCVERLLFPAPVIFNSGLVFIKVF